MNALQTSMYPTQTQINKVYMYNTLFTFADFTAQFLNYAKALIEKLHLSDIT